ncbi:hypothetical protein WN55_09498 [Dufourea novaeangliae]|uniref:Uncharacterized protein n=1 Tax=Dufourea novaeangliae TaxID=178035 RepID=A0A154NYF3_DUFNO|nr:hypothetical protein WN55_09498 [Dufourea novaeangliae]
MRPTPFSRKRNETKEARRCKRGDAAAMAKTKGGGGGGEGGKQILDEGNLQQFTCYYKQITALYAHKLNGTKYVLAPSNVKERNNRNLDEHITVATTKERRRSWSMLALPESISKRKCRKNPGILLDDREDNLYRRGTAVYAQDVCARTEFRGKRALNSRGVESEAPPLLAAVDSPAMEEWGEGVAEKPLKLFSAIPSFDVILLDQDTPYLYQDYVMFTEAHGEPLLATQGS